MKVVFIGAGNLATRLSLEMQRVGMIIGQVYSYTEVNATLLASRLGCSWTTHLEAIDPDADIYVFSLKDTVLQSTIHQVKTTGGLWIHTAGSMSIEVFKGYTKRYGVLYPLQTFSKERVVDFSGIPFFLEANTESDAIYLYELVAKISGNIQFLSSEKRRSLHLAGVFACNFTNHMYFLAGKLLDKQGIDPNVLLPLIDETAAKVHSMTPANAQTGPAIRYDENVINQHLAMLMDPQMRVIYEQISQNIHREAKK